MPAVYYKGSDLPNMIVDWLDTNGVVIDFSVAHTYEVKVGLPGEAALFTKTSGITGFSTLPNLSIAWAVSGELNSLDAGSYDVQIKATRTSDSRERFMSGSLLVLHTIT